MALQFSWVRNGIILLSIWATDQSGPIYEGRLFRMTGDTVGD